MYAIMATLLCSVLYGLLGYGLYLILKRFPRREDDAPIPFLTVFCWPLILLLMVWDEVGHE